MRLFIGSTNENKVDDWHAYLPNWDILSYKDLMNLDKAEVEEGIVSLEENAIKKATAWAERSNMVTLSDDTGFFIPVLGGFPGVSVKRWGGRFEKEMSHGELAQYLKKEVTDIDDLTCYFESAYAIANPDGRTEVFLSRLNGRLDAELLKKDFSGDFHLGVFFIADGMDKSWREATAEERKEKEIEIINKVKRVALNFEYR